MKRLFALLFLSAFALSFTGTGSKKVYICTSKSDKAYHYKHDCIVLNECSNESVTVSLKDAIEIYKRKECVHEVK